MSNMAQVEPTQHRGVALSTVPNIRQNRSGNWEATIKHPMLVKPESRTKSTRWEAAICKLDRLAELDELKLEKDRKLMLLAASGASKQVIRAAAEEKAQTGSTRYLHLGKLLGDWVAGANVNPATKDIAIRLQGWTTRGHLDTTVNKIDYAWAKTMVEVFKQRKLAPSSIRKYVGTISQALDWHLRETYPKDTPPNPLDRLPNGYSIYVRASDDDDVPEDQERDRLLQEGEEARILDVIEGRTRRKCNRPVNHPVETRMFFLLLLWTGLRLREAYRLRVADINVTNRTIWVGRSKTTKAGKKYSGQREVPIRPELLPELQAYLQFKGFTGSSADQLVFPWWDGNTDRDRLRDVTTRVSKMLGALFEDAGCEGLKPHDLRHEAITRWMRMTSKRGDWVYRAEEVRRISGHKTDVCFMRYFNIRGAELAGRMYDDE